MKILFVDTCISALECSRTKILCERYLKRYAGDEHKVTRLAPMELGLTPFSGTMLRRREECIAARDYQDAMFEAARQFQQADEIVIGAPYWDLSFPSALKIFVEHIMVNGLTFKYVGSEAVGLCRAKKMTYIMSAGGFVGGCDFSYEYLKAICRMLGIPESELICAQGLDIVGADVQKLLDEALPE